MKVEIELTPTGERRLLHWASVGRTLSAVERLLDNAIVSQDDEEELSNTTGELKTLHPSIENLHLAYREALNRKAVNDTSVVKREASMASTMQTERIKWQLRQSMGEELAAGSIYMVRSIEAGEAGDTKTKDLFSEIAHDELDDHYNKLVQRLNELGSFETKIAYNPQGVSKLDTVVYYGDLELYNGQVVAMAKEKKSKNMPVKVGDKFWDSLHDQNGEVIAITTGRPEYGTLILADLKEDVLYTPRDAAPGTKPTISAHKGWHIYTPGEWKTIVLKGQITEPTRPEYKWGE